MTIAACRQISNTIAEKNKRRDPGRDQELLQTLLPGGAASIKAEKLPGKCI